MPENTAGRAMIVDPEPFFHEKVRACLSEGGYAVVSQALSSATALQELENLRPDLVVLGPHLEEAEAFTLSREITLRVPDSKVVIFTARMDDPLFQADAAYVGIGACLSRIMSDEECLAIIANVVTGHQSFSPEILTLAFQSIRLTRRECDVLRFMAGGKTDQEIASALGLKLSTIRNHSQHILEKFGVHERREAIRRARRRGLCEKCNALEQI